MSSEIIKTYLESLKSQKKFDAAYIDILLRSNECGEDGETTAGKILEVIEHRYAQDKKNKS